MHWFTQVVMMTIPPMEEGEAMDTNTSLGAPTAKTVVASQSTDVSDKLDLLLERLDRMERRMDTMMEMTQQAPMMLAMMTDTVDDTFRQASMKGIDIEGRIKNLLDMMEKLTADDTAEVLTSLLSRSDQLKQTLEFFDQGPHFIAMVTDMMDELAKAVQSSGIDIHITLKQFYRSFQRFALLVNSGEFEAFLDSGVLGAEAVHMVGTLGKALEQSNSEPPSSVGLFGMLGVMGDKDVQRAMGFLTKVLKHFGKALPNENRALTQG